MIRVGQAHAVGIRPSRSEAHRATVGERFLIYFRQDGSAGNSLKQLTKVDDIGLRYMLIYGTTVE